MGEFNIKKGDVHDTPSAGYQKIYPKADGKWYTKNEAGVESALGVEISALASKALPVIADIAVIEDSADSFTKKKVTLEALRYVGLPVHRLYQTGTNYAPTYAQLVANGSIIAVSTAGGNVTITLPRAQTLPQDGIVRQVFIHHVGGGNVCKVLCDSEAFEDGMISVVLLSGVTAEFGSMYSGPALPGWLRVGSTLQRLQVRRAATWASTNFDTAAAVPFDTQDYEDNTDVLEWAVGTATRLQIKYTGRYTLNYLASIDSTGGMTYNVSMWLRTNGSTEISGTRSRTGNYGGEDQSLSCPDVQVDLTAGSYVELVAEHDGLTGSLYSCRVCTAVGG